MRSMPLRVLTWWALGVVAFGLLFIALRAAGVDVLDLTRDVSYSAGVSEEVGILSAAGLVLWGASAALCALTAVVLGRGPRARYMAWTAVLLIVLLADDTALLHESVLPSSGIPELIIYSVYFASVAAWAILFRREILTSEFPLLLLVGACFAASLGIDAADSVGIELFGDHAAGVAEDFAKLVGIGTLFLYVFREAQEQLGPRSSVAVGGSGNADVTAARGRFRGTQDAPSDERSQARGTQR